MKCIVNSRTFGRFETDFLHQIYLLVTCADLLPWIGIGDFLVNSIDSFHEGGTGIGGLSLVFTHFQIPKVKVRGARDECPFPLAVIKVGMNRFF